MANATKAKQSILTHETKRVMEIISNGGPSKEDYSFLQSFCINNPEKLKEAKNNGLDFLNSSESIMGHIKNKPYGYAGDFHIIDRLYTNDYSKQFEKWDKFSLQNTAAQAVRNRKQYFKNLLNEKLEKKNMEVMNVASGPCRDMYEFFEENESKNELQFTCVEMDARAIEYARDLNTAHVDKFSFINKNIFRFTTEKKYDLVWSAGLFDYFTDKAFVQVLSRMKSWTNPNGEIVIGNFNSENNPSREYMEIFGEWYLNHRTAKELIYLAQQAGFKPEQLSVKREEENVNLFLHITN